MAPRKRNEDSPLLSALRFVKEAQRKEGPPHETHCRIAHNSIVGSDGVLTVGIPLAEDMPEICPNTHTLIHALERARGTVATTVENGRMTIRASKFAAVVPVLDAMTLPYHMPDGAQYPLSDDFRDAALSASIYTREGAQTVVAASVMTRNGTLVGTNGNVVVEAWHGIPTPPGLIIPKAFIDVIGKIKKKITHFGFSDTSFTLWYDDGSWIKTQLYLEQWPNIEPLLSYIDNSHFSELPKDFWEGLKTVAPFSQDGRIWFLDGKIRTSPHDGTGAEYVVKGLPDKQCFNHKYLSPLDGLASLWDWTTNERVATFTGERIRGVVSRSVADI